MRSVATAWAVVVVYMGAVFALSSLSLRSVPGPSFPHFDKVVHAVEYAGLALLATRASLRTWPKHAPWRAALFGAAVAVAWGFLDEVHQIYVPGRDADVRDLVADTVGAIAGAAAALVVSAPVRARRRSEASS